MEHYRTATSLTMLQKQPSSSVQGLWRRNCQIGHEQSTKEGAKESTRAAKKRAKAKDTAVGKEKTKAWLREQQRTEQRKHRTSITTQRQERQRVQKKMKDVNRRRERKHTDMLQMRRNAEQQCTTSARATRQNNRWMQQTNETHRAITTTHVMVDK